MHLPWEVVYPIVPGNGMSTDYPEPGDTLPVGESLEESLEQWLDQSPMGGPCAPDLVPNLSLNLQSRGRSAPKGIFTYGTQD